MCCQRRGAEMSLVQLCRHFKENLFHAVPSLWTHIHQPLIKLPQVPDNKEEGTWIGFKLSMHNWSNSVQVTVGYRCNVLLLYAVWVTNRWKQYRVRQCAIYEVHSSSHTMGCLARHSP